MCVQQVQGSYASERRQVYSDVSVFWDTSRVPQPESCPPSGHSQSHQHNHDDYGSNTAVLITRTTDITMICTADTPSALSTGHQPDLWQPQCRSDEHGQKGGWCSTPAFRFKSCMCIHEAGVMDRDVWLQRWFKVNYFSNYWTIRYEFECKHSLSSEDESYWLILWPLAAGSYVRFLEWPAPACVAVKQ